MKVAVRRIGVSSLGRLGCLLGVVAAALPSLLCGVLALALARRLHHWLSGLQGMTVTVLGQEMAPVGWLHALGLEELFDWLQALTSLSLPVTLLGILALALCSGALLAAIVVLVGLAYNLLASAAGGLELELEPLRKEKTE